MLNGIQVKRFGMSFFTDEQIKSEGNQSILAFCAEIISSNDQINDVKKKLKEYFEHGVRVGYLFSRTRIG